MNAAGVYEAVKHAVVLVTSSSRLRHGSGFFADRRGLVVTNRHVVADTEDLLVRLYDTTELPARLIWSSPTPDLAFLLVGGEGHPELPLAKQDSLRAGQDVFAIGHPKEFRNTITAGIVSGISQLFQGARYIQIDAPINRGNSGGPVLNSSGEVIGVSTAIRPESQGIAFAIPSSAIREHLAPLLDRFQDLASMLYCPICGELNEPALSYCVVCGRSFERNFDSSTLAAKKNTARRVGTSNCTACGQASVETASRYCPACGAAFDRNEGD